MNVWKDSFDFIDVDTRSYSSSAICSGRFTGPFYIENVLAMVYRSGTSINGCGYNLTILMVFFDKILRLS